MKQMKNIAVVAIALVLTFVLGVVAAFGQDSLPGKYEGTAKTAGAADSQIMLELKNDGGKISGHLMNGQTGFDISEGTLADGKLTLKLGPAAKDGVVTLKVDADKLSGEWVAGTTKKTVELKKAGAAAATAAKPAAFNLAGQWEAVADANGQAVPFLLTLAVDGEKVTGGSSSQLGDSTIKNGQWKDGKLTIELEGQNGVIAMSAVVVDGKLSGEFDFAGQLQGKWVAVKKN